MSSSREVVSSSVCLDDVQTMIPPAPSPTGMLGAIISPVRKQTSSKYYTTISSSVSPKKEKEQRTKSQSAIHRAIAQAKDKPHGLMKFFKQNSRKEYNEQVWRHTAEEDEFAQQKKEIGDAVHRHRVEKERAGACERQQKRRRIIRDAEIANGERSPGGTKYNRKVSDVLNYIARTRLSFYVSATLLNLKISPPNARSIALQSFPVQSVHKKSASVRRKNIKAGRERMELVMLCITIGSPLSCGVRLMERQSTPL
jgi:hypothetical protein